MRRLEPPRPGLLLPRVLAQLLLQQLWALSVSCRPRPLGFLIQPLHFPCLRLFVADDPDGLARTFAGARVRARSLPTNGQAPTMPDPAITIDRLPSLQLRVLFTPQRDFDRS